MGTGKFFFNFCCHITENVVMRFWCKVDNILVHYPITTLQGRVFSLIHYALIVMVSIYCGEYCGNTNSDRQYKFCVIFVSVITITSNLAVFLSLILRYLMFSLKIRN